MKRKKNITTEEEIKTLLRKTERIKSRARQNSNTSTI